MTVGQNAATDPLEQFLEPTKDLLRRIGDLERSVGGATVFGGTAASRSVLVRWRSDTAANWTSVNPTLALGEPGFEQDTNKFKIGTGAAAWTALAYA